MEEGKGPVKTLVEKYIMIIFLCFYLKSCKTNLPTAVSWSNPRGGGGEKSSKTFVSLIGRGSDGGFWRKTSSQSSCERPVEDSCGCCWSAGPKKLDSEIRRDDRWWEVDGWEDGGDDDDVLLLSFLFSVGKMRLPFPPEYPSICSRLKVRPVHRSSSTPASLKLCPVSVFVSRPSS